MGEVGTFDGLERIERTERDRETERLLTFVDAVVAIAITLLVLPLVDVAGELGSSGGSVAALLRAHTGQLAAFFLSFFVIANLWVDQHVMMRTVVRSSHGVTALLLLWSATVVLLPFPTSLLAAAASQTATKVLYLGTMAVSSALLTVLSGQIRRHRDLRDSDEAPDALSPALSMAIYVLTLATALLLPVLSYWPLLLLRLTGLAGRRWRRRHPLSAPRSSGPASS